MPTKQAIREHDVVTLISGVRNHGLKVGTVGVVIHCYVSGNLEIEVADDTMTRTVTMRRNQVRKI